MSLVTKSQQSLILLGILKRLLEKFIELMSKLKSIFLVSQVHRADYRDLILIRTAFRLMRESLADTLKIVNRHLINRTFGMTQERSKVIIRRLRLL